MDWKAQKKTCIITIFAYLLFLHEVNSFLFAGDFSRSHLFRCLTDSKNIDCHSPQNRICCNLIKRKLSRVQGARQFPHFPARSDISLPELNQDLKPDQELNPDQDVKPDQEFKLDQDFKLDQSFKQDQELNPDQDFKPDQLPNTDTDYEDIITKDSPDINFAMKDLPIIRVDSSFSFEPNERSKKEFSRAEDNIVDVGEKLIEKHIDDDDVDDDDQMCKTLEVPCHVIPNHPCCKRQKPEIVVGKPIAKIEKLFDYSRINLMRSTIPPKRLAVAEAKIIENQKEEEFDPKCGSHKFSCRSSPNHPCCIRPTEDSKSSTAADIRHSHPTRRTYFRPKTDPKTSQHVFDENETKESEKSEDSLEHQDPHLTDDQVEMNQQDSDLSEELKGQELDSNEEINSQELKKDDVQEIADHKIENFGQKFAPGEHYFSEDQKSEATTDDHDSDMCRTLQVPCLAIPNHPCCKHVNIYSVEFPTEDENSNKFLTTSETTVPPRNSENEREHRFRMCSVLAISCQSQPDHSCCQNSNEQTKAENDSEEQEEEEYQDAEEDDFNFSRIAVNNETPKPYRTPTTSLPNTPDTTVKDNHRIISPSQMHKQKACKGLQIDCYEQATHPCCKYDSLSEKEIVPVLTKLKENEYDVEQPFDFSRIANHKTTSSLAFPSTERPYLDKTRSHLEKTEQILETSNDSLERNDSELVEENSADQPSKFLGGQRRAMKPLTDGKNSTSGQAESSKDQMESNESNNSTENEMIGEKGYDKGMCAILKVPCRFVSDHPCCDFEMPIDLVARARSMDGSADLKWRKLKTSGPQARSIDTIFADEEHTQPRNANVVNRKIEYNHATSKSSVSIPQYHFDGGPEVTSTILGVCWRLTQLRCPTPPMPSSDPQPDPVLSRTTEKVHPCCQLNRKPGVDTTGDSRISKWLSVTSDQ